MNENFGIDKWFWGEGDKMYCDVDYDGNTEWNCQECEDKREVLYKIPTGGGEEE